MCHLMKPVKNSPISSNNHKPCPFQVIFNPVSIDKDKTIKYAIDSLTNFKHNHTRLPHDYFWLKKLKLQLSINLGWNIKNDLKQKLAFIQANKIPVGK